LHEKKDELAANMKQEMSWIKVSFSVVQQNGRAEQQKRQVTEQQNVSNAMQNATQAWLVQDTMTVQMKEKMQI
jgi:hypothetical protein